MKTSKIPTKDNTLTNSYIDRESIGIGSVGEDSKIMGEKGIDEFNSESINPQKATRDMLRSRNVVDPRAAFMKSTYIGSYKLRI